MAKKIFATILLLMVSQGAFAKENNFVIFDVHKNFPLHSNEKIYHDYYINAGQDQGVKVGDKVKIYRRVPLTDVYSNQAQPDLTVEIGALKVIQVQNTMSVARPVLERKPANTPVVFYEKFMRGDCVQLARQNVITNSDDSNSENTENQTTENQSNP